MANYGRPLKGKTRRVPITVHSSVGMLDIIDEYVEERDQQQEGAYSRSDFYNEAATAYLKLLGKLPEEEADTEKRSKNVPEKIGEKNRPDNLDNTNNRNA
jgi:hypothetical protein